MTSIRKQYLKLALAIEAQVLAVNKRGPGIGLPITLWEQCDRIASQVRRAESRGWDLAATELRRDLRHAVGNLLPTISTIHAGLPSILPGSVTTKAADIYEDLLALEEEFEELEFDLHENRNSVSTDPISLDSVYLGPFEVRLNLRQLLNSDSVPFRVIAKDPHPAESRSNVTHPHVMDEILCEGDGRHAIRQALSQGWLLDFFLLVRGVLRTYNSESPFVELALWSGQTCSDCGTTMHEDECYSCKRCSDIVCSECEVSCNGCSSSICNGCSAMCPSCKEVYCTRCMTKCGDCGSTSCGKCLTNERCNYCNEEAEDFEESSAQASV